MKGSFVYYTQDIKHAGAFHVYQARNGAIMMIMANRTITLSKTQVETLSIDCYSLDDFDNDNYIAYYLLRTIA